MTTMTTSTVDGWICRDHVVRMSGREILRTLAYTVAIALDVLALVAFFALDPRAFPVRSSPVFMVGAAVALGAVALGLGSHFRDREPARRIAAEIGLLFVTFGVLAFLADAYRPEPTRNCWQDARVSAQAP